MASRDIKGSVAGYLTFLLSIRFIRFIDTQLSVFNFESLMRSTDCNQGLNLTITAISTVIVYTVYTYMCTLLYI